MAIEDQAASARLGAFAAGLRFEDIPTGAVREAGRMVLDTLGCMIAAWREDGRKAAMARALAEDLGARGQASIVGGGRSHPAVSALANGILANAADNDDTHKRALIHVGSVVVPAALAVAEERGLGGRDVVAALVAGYEVAVRAGLAVMPSHYRFWHSTATNGTFGAAAAAARALGLEAAQIQAALGFAGTQAAGLNAFFETGDDTKSLHPGKAAMNGVLAARLAALGASSPPDIFGHPKGYLAAYSLAPDPGALTEGLGETWEIEQNGYKPYPSILASHSPIGAALAIAAERPDPSEIERVAVETYATVKTHFSSKRVDSTMAARLSVPYCVAVALVDGMVSQRQFSPDRFRDPLVRRLLACTEVVADEALSRLYPEKFPARVIVTMRDGRVLQSELMFPKGDPQNPLTDAELADKFRNNARDFLVPDEIERLIDNVLDLGRLGSCEALTRTLRKP